MRAPAQSRLEAANSILDPHRTDDKQMRMRMLKWAGKTWLPALHIAHALATHEFVYTCVVKKGQRIRGDAGWVVLQVRQYAIHFLHHHLHQGHTEWGRKPEVN